MLTEGMFLVDRYEILSKVGAGGMSDVYKAKDHILGRVVAIKVLKNEYSEDVNFVTKFRTEAQSAAGLEHPNIVNIYDVGSENGLHFIVMEHIEGITLKTYIEKKGQLSFKEATSIAIQVARGIEAAHNKDIIHRDIKPQNIIISTEGKVKVTDFGIARAVSGNTISAEAMGSVHYASPEQARNGFVDGRSDIYSLGIVMYEMVTGRVPFDGETTVAVAIQHLQEEMVEPSAFAPDLPISYEKIVLKATQKSPDRRYQDIAEFLVDLRKALVSPDEDFVVIAPILSDKTRVITGDELEMIQNTAENADLDKETGFASTDDEIEDGEEDDGDDASAFLDPKMEKVVTVAGIAVAAVIIILIIYLVISFFGLFNRGDSKNTEDSQTESQTETESEEVEMIDILGMSVEEAEDALEELGLKLNIIDYEESEDEEAGTILEQSESAGNMVAKGTVINVTVVGEDETEVANVPDVLEKKESNAVKALENAGFKVSKDYEYNDTVKKGYVISQTPGAGEEVKKGSTVTIVISSGPETTNSEATTATVPNNLVGKTKDYATGVLENLGFKVYVAEKESDEAAGTVLEVEDAGSEVKIGSTINIYVSKGPADTGSSETTGSSEDAGSTDNTGDATN